MPFIYDCHFSIVQQAHCLLWEAGAFILFKEGTMHVGIVMGSDSDLPVMKKPQKF